MTSQSEQAVSGKVWITRAQPGAQRTADAVRALGFTPVIAPVLSVEPLSPALPDVMEGVVFTSRNGVNAFAGLSPQRDLTALCVGDATADAARHTGFAEVMSAASDAVGLRAMIGETWPKSRPLLYAAPLEPSAPVGDWLTSDGFAIQSVAVYRTVAIKPDLSPADVAALNIVMLHSARAARQVADLLRHYAIKPLKFISISATVDAAFKDEWAQNIPQNWQIAISAFPDEASMLSLL